MKKVLLFCAGLLLFGAGCRKEEEGYRIPIYEAGPQDTGWAEASRDGEDWTATGYGLMGQSRAFLALRFVTYNEYGDQRENFGLNDIPIQTGKYLIKGDPDDHDDNFIGSAYGLFTSDGDAIIATYHNDESIEGFLELTLVDTLNKRVEGVFGICQFERHYPDE